MPGQPIVFDFAKVIPTELPAIILQPPFAIVQEGDSLTLRTYFHCGGTPFERAGISAVLAGASAEVVYFFEDLEVGGAPIKVAGGAISKLTAAQKTAAFAAGGDLEGSGLPQTDDYYLSADTAPITTGAGNTLQIPVGNQTGTWRVLAYINGGPGTFVSAFDDNLLIQVTV